MQTMPSMNDLWQVCGVVRVEDASCAIGAGANLIGVIFAKSKRQANSEQVRCLNLVGGDDWFMLELIPMN